jgi:hypothetical protein
MWTCGPGARAAFKHRMRSGKGALSSAYGSSPRYRGPWDLTVTRELTIQSPTRHLLTAKQCYHTAQEARSGNLLTLHRRGPVDGSRRHHRHGRKISLAATFNKDYPLLRDMALPTNKHMTLDAAENRSIVRDHVRKNQVSATRCTTHC